MFDWFRRLFSPRLRFPWSLDALNAEAGGGKPVTSNAFLGSLFIPSGALLLGDPQSFPDAELEIPDIDSGEAVISASLWRYPSGMVIVKSLKLSFAGPNERMSRRKIGEVGIDSAKLLVADKADIDEHWTEVGKDRTGVIPTAADDTVLRMLTKRFQLKTRRVNPWCAEVADPVSESLAKEIEDYLRSQPKYADYPFIYFHVQTNNSFDRANYMQGGWSFMPIGNSEVPLMFVCGTGRGDGLYEVEGEFAGKSPRLLSITFIEE